MNGSLVLREVRDDDVALFFEHQLDREAAWMAAFTREGSEDTIAFHAHWARIRGDPSVVLRTIEEDGRVAGFMVRHEEFGHPEVGYWLDRACWGRGVATRALRLFLEVVRERPLYAHVAEGNAASLRVLEKCGFRPSGEIRAFARARGAEILEHVLVLEARR